MTKLQITLLMILSIMLSFLVVPASAVPNENEKVPVLIKFKDNTDKELVKAHGGEIKYDYDIVPAIAAKLPEKAVRALSKNPNIELIEADGIAQVTGETTPWGVSKVNAPDAHALGLKGSGVRVAVIDTGVDYNHPDLASNYLGGYDYVNNDNDPMDDHSHGTHVAGTVVAIDNDIGVLGIAPDVGIYALKAADAGGSCSYSDIIASINWAVENNADVITMSLGGSYSSTLKTACDNAYESGVVLVGAAGNSGGPVIYPAGYGSVIAVSATDSNDVKASWSSYGPEVELAAPGVSVYSTMPGSSYGYKSGTSMATPHVTGSVALLLSTDISGSDLDFDNDGTWDPEEVRSRLQSTATDLGETGKDDYYGYGLVNVLAAVSDLDQSPPSTEEPTESPTDDPSTDTSTDSPASDSPIKMHLKELSVTTDYDVKARKHVFAWATSTATVVDAEGNPVSGATLSGDWSGIVSGSVSGLTDTNGIVTFSTNRLKNPSGSFVFTVSDIVLDGHEYDSSANSCDDSDSVPFTFSL